MKLILGDCLEEIKKLEPNSINSMVTDPPAGIAFMGKEWDKSDGFIPFMTSVMKEALRVLKPGAHGLVWAIPRTSHWTATALEAAGFEIRDVVTHLFGSGFPKSLDISKAIDKAAGAEREVISTHKTKDIRTKVSEPNIDNQPKLAPGSPTIYMNYDVTAPSTPEAKQWQGWGTALKPASEHWILIRKPISENTVAANVLRWGCGALNIDASRIGTKDNLNGGAYSGDDQASKTGSIMKIVGDPGKYKQPQGRFPANLVLSHNEDCDDKCTLGCAGAELDRQSGHLDPGGQSSCANSDSANSTFGIGLNGTERKFKYKDSGGASRFFKTFENDSRFLYCAKASKRERNEGLDSPSTHPTVKPIKLMQYLITMVTPLGGICLDPFMGSGSTGVAAIKSGFNFIGIEREQEYFEIAEKRISHALEGLKCLNQA